MRATPLIRTGIATCLTATLSVLAAAPAPSYAAALSMTLNSASGPSGGGNALLATVNPAGTLPFPAGTVPAVQFQFNAAGATACRTTAQPVTQMDGTASALTDGVLTVNPATVKRLSTTRVVFTVPSSAYPESVAGNPSTVNTDGLALFAGQATSKWNVCIYDTDSTTSSTLIAGSTYTLAVRPVITSILPAGSTPAGGQSITVNGIGFTPGTTASIDGAPLTGLQFAGNGNSFTGTTSPHAGGAGLALVVKTLGGQVSSANPDNDDQTADAPILFSYDNSIVVAPNTATVGSTATLDIQGAGFARLTFDPSAAATDPTAHIFLVKDDYDPVANRGVQECTAVLLIDDAEVICTLDLSADRLDPATSAPVTGFPVVNGTYTVTVVADGSTGAPDDDTNASIVTSDATFTVAPH